jgi:hypothetical protein
MDAKREETGTEIKLLFSYFLKLTHMSESEKPTGQQKFWNFMATIIYIVLIVLLGYVMKQKGIKIEQIRIWEVFVLALASYRLTRILVFDKIFKFFRDFFRSKSRLQVFYVVKEILGCPWCAGVWVALVNVTIYFLVPYGSLFIYLLAIAGIASFFVIFVNYFGLSVEEKQHAVKSLKEESDYTKPGAE